ncbi:MAG: FAD-dependent oxidoreductase, partial [Candidatus Flemingiibacterium sp.]
METNRKFDVIVLGGGFTGCAAAIAAARQGMKVLLLEASGYLGGAA